ncbi:MFS general substrate transporter [Daedaleopsis nitida]|nr:MFS general substrate transporter [Daedaleopsis nitida]
MSTTTDLAQVPSKPKAESFELSDKVSSASTDETPVAELTDDSLVPSSVWAKIDLCILPVVSLMYFLSSLDKSNIGNARIAGLQQRLDINDKEFTIALTVTLIPYILIEIPSNVLLKFVGARFLLPTMVVLWGFACAMQGVVTNYSGLIACRFFLGLFEGGLLPGIALYMATFYPRRKLQLRMSVMFSATALASAFSGLLAAAIIKMNGVGGRAGYEWLFILEGLFTIVFGLVSYFLLPNTPVTVPALTDSEKRLVTKALRDDGIILANEKDEHYTAAELLRTFMAPHVILMAIAGFFSGASLSGLSTFLPSIVVGLGYSGSRAQLMTVPPFAVSAVLSILTSIFSDYYGKRGLTIIFFAGLSAIGFGIFYESFASNIRYGALFLLVPGTFCVGAPLGTWMANNSAPLMRRATSIALLTTMTNLGSVLASWLFGFISPAPRYTSATVTLLVFQVATALLAGVNVTWLTRENKRKEVAKARADGPPKSTVVPNESIWYTYVL